MGMKSFFIVFLLAAMLLPSFANAAGTSFNPSLVIYDGDLKNYSAMTPSDIQAFLDEHDGILKEMIFVDRDGKERTAAQVIARAAATAKINPQVLLVLLQKEQSLIERGVPTIKALDWALGYGVCDNCSMNDSAMRPFRGFATQLYGAATRLREYVDSPQKFGWIKRGKPVVISGITVIPATEATRALYLYTPHIASAQTFWNLWNRYFGKPYPDGTVLHDMGTDTIWRIENGSRRQFASAAVAVSLFDERFILDVPHTVLANYPEGALIRFANYSLVKTQRGAVYLIVDGKKRLISSQTVFKSLGYNPEELILAKDSDLKDYPSGSDITSNSDTPQGRVLESAENGTRYLVVDNMRHLVTSNAILYVAIPNASITTVPNKEITKYKESTPLRFPDGTLMARADGSLAVVSGGKRQEFASLDIAITLGYNPSRAIVVNEEIWTLHPQGEGITIPPPDADPEGAAAMLAQSGLGR